MNEPAITFGIRDKDGDLLPPWLAFPDLPRFSIGWRKRPPESHFTEWTSWYVALQEDARRSYRRRYRAPWPLWTGSYLTLSSSVATTLFGIAATACVLFDSCDFAFCLVSLRAWH